MNGFMCKTGRKSAVFCVRWYWTYRAAKLGGWRPGCWCRKPGRLRPSAAAPRARLPPLPGCRPTRSAGWTRSEPPAWGWWRWNSPPRIRLSIPGCPLPAFEGIFLGRLAGCQQPALKTLSTNALRKESRKYPQITNAKRNITHDEHAAMFLSLNNPLKKGRN